MENGVAMNRHKLTPKLEDTADTHGRTSGSSMKGPHKEVTTTENR